MTSLPSLRLLRASEEQEMLTVRLMEHGRRVMVLDGDYAPNWTLDNRGASAPQS